jgi:hypothetical protein
MGNNNNPQRRNKTNQDSVVSELKALGPQNPTFEPMGNNNNPQRRNKTNQDSVVSELKALGPQTPEFEPMGNNNNPQRHNKTNQDSVVSELKALGPQTPDFEPMANNNNPQRHNKTNQDSVVSELKALGPQTPEFEPMANNNNPQRRNKTDQDSVVSELKALGPQTPEFEPMANNNNPQRRNKTDQDSVVVEPKTPKRTHSLYQKRYILEDLKKYLIDFRKASGNMKKDRTASEQDLEILYKYYMQEDVDLQAVKNAVNSFKQWSRIRNTKTAKNYNGSKSNQNNKALDTAVQEIFDGILNYSPTIEKPTYIPRKTIKGGKRKSNRMTRRR